MTNLTEQYDVGGTLICAEGSYVYTEKGIEKVHYCQVGCITERVTPKVSIIAPVPSYKEWQKLDEMCKHWSMQETERTMECVKLKELLSKCVLRVDTLSDILDFLKDKVVYKQSKQLADMLKSTREIIKEIDEVLK